MSSNPSQAAVPEVIPGQLSLREYFVAHAPEAPNSFEPVMPEVKWPEKLPRGSSIASTASLALDQDWSREEAQAHTQNWDIDDIELLFSYLEQYHVAADQREQNAKNEAVERALQWPLYWADTMIARLNK